MNDTSTAPVLPGGGITCNGSVFLYFGNKNFLLVYIVLNILAWLFLTYKTCRLCTIAFSYSNFHVHQNYKLLALAILNLAIITMARVAQYNYQTTYQEYQEHPQRYDVSIVGTGYQLLVDIFGIFSMFSNNYMHLYNAFTWLNIALQCDYNSVTASEANSSFFQNNQSAQRTQKERKKKWIKYIRVFTIYGLNLGMLVVSFVGTLDHKKNDSWCGYVTAMMVASSFIPFLIFAVAVFLFAKNFWDPEISKMIKLGLVYLLLTMVIRNIYYLIVSYGKDHTPPFDALNTFGDILNLLYTVFCTLVPTILMSLLCESQLKKEQYNLLRRSSLIFKSTIL